MRNWTPELPRLPNWPGMLIDDDILEQKIKIVSSDTEHITEQYYNYKRCLGISEHKLCFANIPSAYLSGEGEVKLIAIGKIHEVS